LLQAQEDLDVGPGDAEVMLQVPVELGEHGSR
jgi:hypothetical protein